MRWPLLPWYQLLQGTLARGFRIACGTLFFIASLCCPLLLLHVTQECNIEERCPRGLEDTACLQPALVQVGHILKITIYPHLTNTAWQVIEQPGKTEL